MKGEHKIKIRDASLDSQPKIQSFLVREIFQRIMGADQQRLQISDLHFDKFPTPVTFARWKIRFKTEVCTSSQFPTEAMTWIKEVEMVDSVDDLKSSSSTRGISMPNFEVLDARIASALNKIIHNSQFKRRISLEEQKGPEAAALDFSAERAKHSVTHKWTLPRGSLAVLSVDCEEWFYIILGSLPSARRAIVCILLWLEQSQVVDRVFAEVLLHASNFEFFQLLLRCRCASTRYSVVQQCLVYSPLDG